MNWLDSLQDADVSTIIAVLALIISLIVMFFNARQLSLLVRQLHLDSLIKISEGNFQILSLGFDKPNLWETLYDSKDIRPAKKVEEQKRYLQLWFNHMHVIWKAHKLGLLDSGEWRACKLDITTFLEIESLKAHWEEVKSCFPEPFQKFVDSTIRSVRNE